MRVLFYSPVKLQSGGGCERWHCDITNSLKKQGIEAEIVTGNLGEDRWDKQTLKTQLNGISYTRLDFPVFAGIIIPTLPKFLFLLKKFKEADSVHFIYGFLGQDLMVALLKLLSGKKVIVGHHAPTFHSGLIHNLYMKFVSRYIMRYFDYHMTLNNKDRLFFEKQWNIKNVNFIPSGVKVEKYLNLKRKKSVKLTFLSVGRLSMQKGTDLLAEAILMFNKNFPENNCQFITIGSGILEGSVRTLANDVKNVSFLGFVDDKMLLKMYEVSDVYLSTSREEPFGLVLIEAWSAGMPILATKTEGPKDMLIERENGWFIKECNAESIYKSIVYVYNHYQKDQQFALKMEKRCRETGKEYSIDETAKKMIKRFL